MTVLDYSLLIEIAWPLAAIVASVLLFLFGRRWLQRQTDEFKAMRKEIDDQRAEIAKRDGEWVAQFETAERDNNQRIAHCERNISAKDSDFKPLGKQYNPRA